MSVIMIMGMVMNMSTIIIVTAIHMKKKGNSAIVTMSYSNNLIKMLKTRSTKTMNIITAIKARKFTAMNMVTITIMIINMGILKTKLLKRDHLFTN